MKTKMSKSDIKETFGNILGEDLTEEEKKIKFEEFSKSFLENINTIKADIVNIKEDKEKNIEFHERRISNLESHKTTETKELIQKEIDLIKMMKKELSWIDSCHSFFDICERLLSFIAYDDILSYPEKISKLILEIEILNKDLKEKGIIKGD